jgi:DNA polymerase III delta prime subunit
MGLCWTEKYRPNRQSDIVGDKTHLKALSTWVSNFNKAPQKGKPPSHTTANVTGDHGVGKSLGVDLVLKSCGYEPKKLELGAIRSCSESELARYLNRVVGSQNVDMMLTGFQQRKTAIVIDDIEAISAGNEREGLHAVHKYNEKHRLFPLVIISTNRHSKVISRIVQKPGSGCTVIRFPQPGYNDMMEMINRICEREEFRIDGVREFIINAQGDMSRLINMLEELRRMYLTRSRIDTRAVHEFCEMMHKKDTNIGLYDQTRMLLERFPGIEESLRLFSSDNVILPLMVHENALAAIQDRKDALSLREDDVLNGLMEISESISYGDILENTMHGEQLWYMKDMYGMASCVKPAWLLNRKWPRERSYVNIQFTRDVNKIYIQKINYGHIKVVRPFFGDRTIQGYLMAGMIAAKLIGANDIEGLRRLFAGYPGITTSVVESLLKINKISSIVRTKREKRTKILKRAFDGFVKPARGAIVVNIDDEISD